MGLNFHPRVVGVMAVKDNRNHEFHMLETAAFDPIWTEFDGDRLGKCTIPCTHDYGQVFKSKNAFPLNDEWSAYDGPQLEAATPTKGHFWDIRGHKKEAIEERSEEVKTLTYDRETLSKAEYKVEEDNYPATNRTMENFFKGAWTYHVHNQVSILFSILEGGVIRKVS